MKKAADFRLSAREALKNNWAIAVGAGLVASLLGGTTAGGGGFSFNFNFNSTAESGSGTATDVFAGEEYFSEFVGVFLAALLIGLAVGLVVSAVFFVIGSIVRVGYIRFNLDLVDRKEASFSKLFSFFSHGGKAVVTELLRALFVFLWSLLFVIPGIIASYNYAMASYILAENPDISASEALARSKEMMYGNRWRFFCLSISFIGWEILSVFTCGIGSLWLLPYKEAAFADFYREISGTRRTDDYDFADGNFEQINEAPLSES